MQNPGSDAGVFVWQTRRLAPSPESIRRSFIMLSQISTSHLEQWITRSMLRIASGTTGSGLAPFSDFPVVHRPT